jgi:hypothetical protein
VGWRAAARVVKQWQQHTRAGNGGGCSMGGRTGIGGAGGSAVCVVRVPRSALLDRATNLLRPKWAIVS